MNTRLPLVILFLLSSWIPGAAHAGAPAHLWSHLHGNSSDQYGQAVAIDATGNVIVAGTFWGSIDLGGGVLTSAGLTDIFLAKFDAAGAHVWSRRFGDPGIQTAASVAVDASGNIAQVGFFRGTVDFGGGGLASAGSNDAFVAFYDEDGMHLWSRSFGATSADYGNAVAFDPHGNVVLAGSYVGTVDFGGGPLAGSGGADIFLVSFNAAGAHRWSKRFGDGDYQEAWALSVDPDGRAAVGGEFAGSVDFGGGTMTSAGESDAFVAVFDSTGTFAWSHGFGDALAQSCLSVAMDGDGNAWATGEFKGTIDAGGGPLTSAGDTDVFVVKYDPAGTHAASAIYGGLDFQSGYSIATDASGNAYLAGAFLEDIDFGGGALSSAGGYDIFVAALAPDLSHRWSARFGGASSDAGYWIAVDESGSFVLTGVARGTVDFGGGPLVAAGGADMFLASFTTILTGVDAPRSGGPLALSVYPNPFNPRTTVSVTMPRAARATVEIFDARGARVATLLDDADLGAGTHAIAWNGTDDAGRTASSGVYFARVLAGGAAATHKLIMLK
jgi:hypothetical protein